MTATITPTLTVSAANTTTPTSARTASTTAPLWRVAALAGVAAAAATTVVAVAAKALDVPMMAAPQNAAAGEAIPLYGFATGTLMCTVIGTLLAAALAWKVKRAVGTFLVITTVLTLVSFAGPATTGHATTATRLVLDLTHVVAAVIVIPALAWWVAQRTATR